MGIYERVIKLLLEPFGCYTDSVLTTSRGKDVCSMTRYGITRAGAADQLG